MLDFTFDDYEDESERGEVVHTIQLKDQKGKTFYDKLTYIYLEIPNFKKSENQQVDRLDSWLYFIKNLEDFQVIPTIFKDEIFIQAFDKAELAKFNYNEREWYEYSLKVFRYNKNTYDYTVETAVRKAKEIEHKEGFELRELQGELKGELQGELNGKYLVIDNGIAIGLSLENLSALTGFTCEAIEGYMNLKK